jgi:phosphomannomutase
VAPGDILGVITPQFFGANEVVTPVPPNTLVRSMGEFDVTRLEIGSPHAITGIEAAPKTRTLSNEPNGGVLLGFDATRHGRRFSALATRDSGLPILSVLSAARDSLAVALIAAVPSRRTAKDRLQDVPREASNALVQRPIIGDLSLLPEGLGALQSVDMSKRRPRPIDFRLAVGGAVNFLRI